MFLPFDNNDSAVTVQAQFGIEYHHVGRGAGSERSCFPLQNRGGTHRQKLDYIHQAERALLHEQQQRRQRRLQSYQAGGGEIVLAHLVHLMVWRVVGRNGVDRPVAQPLQQGRHVFPVRRGGFTFVFVSYARCVAVAPGNVGHRPITRSSVITR